MEWILNRQQQAPCAETSTRLLCPSPYDPQGQRCGKVRRSRPLAYDVNFTDRLGHRGALRKCPGNATSGSTGLGTRCSVAVDSGQLSVLVMAVGFLAITADDVLAHRIGYAGELCATATCSATLRDLLNISSSVSSPSCCSPILILANGCCSFHMKSSLSGGRCFSWAYHCRVGACVAQV